MSIATFESSIVPFNEMGRYTGSIDIEINHHPQSNAFFIKACGSRVFLESFHGNHIEKLQSVFGQVVTARDESLGMKYVYQDEENMRLYGAGVPFTDEEIDKKIEANANRFINGDPFGRFKVINKETNQIIGFAAIGHGYVAGESQAALILSKNEHAKKYGKEVALLVGALALAYFENQFQVGESDNKKPVVSFTATARDSNLISRQLLAKLGLVKIRDLTEKERLSSEPSSLYGIDGDKVIKQLSEMMDINKLHIQFNEDF